MKWSRARKYLEKFSPSDKFGIKIQWTDQFVLWFGNFGVNKLTFCDLFYFNLDE